MGEKACLGVHHVFIGMRNATSPHMACVVGYRHCPPILKSKKTHYQQWYIELATRYCRIVVFTPENLRNKITGSPATFMVGILMSGLWRI